MAIAREMLHGAPASARRRTHAPASIRGKVISITHVPKVAHGTHTCAHCRTSIKGHPVTFWSKAHPPKHYHVRHARHHALHGTHRKAA